MESFKRIFLIFLISLNFTNLFSGLLPKTLIFMGNETYIWAKDLKVGYPIPIYNIPEHKMEYEKREIEEVKTRKTKKLVIIEIEGDDGIVVGPKQKLYNRRIKQFIPAKEFQVGDLLFAPDKGNLEVTNIEIKRLDNEITVYAFAIEDRNLFLILSHKKSHILAHNFAMEVAIFTCENGAKILEAAVTVFGGVLVAIGLTKSSGPMKWFSKKVSKKKINTDEKQKPDDAIDKILKDSRPGRETKGKTKQFEKDGGKEDCDKDFDKIEFDRVDSYSDNDVKVGYISDGRKVISRTTSTDKKSKATLEFQKGNKIRYK